MAALITVGIYGASGYMGGEALRVLNEHPQVRVAWATSRSGKPIEYFHRNLYGSGIHLIKPEEVSNCDVVLLSLPAGNAMTMVPDLLKNGTKIIDLGADFRLKDRTVWERIYGRTHLSWNFAHEAIYGIPELHRDEIRRARIIANPGCFSSASILGLAPLIKEDMIDTERIVIDGLSGTAGAGSELSSI
jgi:N-acetyl-gamma-glutamyl-phosphate reductase common form